ncbi:PaaI family thioesterase [Kiloniella majae]|uniref:PaaI family thioesterase n=1 Tax=Kiloniella majae TaxID=1938558 RepID=UPI000A278BC2|nr:PaaI family thioesterase [Kiloniella majae]
MAKTHFEPRNPAYADLIRDSYNNTGFGKTLGAELTVIEPGYVEMELPFRPELSQHHGFFQGGVIGALADYVGGYATYTLIEENDSILTVEYKINMMAPGAGKKLIGKGTVLRAGRRVTIARMDVYALQNDNSEVHIAAAQGTFMRMENKPDVAATIAKIQKTRIEN